MARESPCRNQHRSRDPGCLKGWRRAACTASSIPGADLGTRGASASRTEAAPVCVVIFQPSATSAYTLQVPIPSQCIALVSRRARRATACRCRRRRERRRLRPSTSILASRAAIVNELVGSEVLREEASPTLLVECAQHQPPVRPDRRTCTSSARATPCRGETPRAVGRRPACPTRASRDRRFRGSRLHLIERCSAAAMAIVVVRPAEPSAGRIGRCP